MLRPAGIAVLLAAAAAAGFAATPAWRAFDVRPVAVGRAELRAVAQSQTAFALDVYGRLAQTPGNVVFSPLSLATALAMTERGAAGRTRREIDAVLHVGARPARFAVAWQSVLARLSADATEDVEITAADALFTDHQAALRPAFVKALRQRFDAAAGPLDAVNAWAAERTNGLIPRALDEAPEDGAFVLADALRFVGKWETPFDHRQDDIFDAPDGAVSTPLMRLEGALRFARTDDYDLVELPYRGGAFAMLVVVPWGPLDAVEAALTPRRLAESIAAMQTEALDLRFPPFSFESSLDLEDALGSLGMATAFSPDADFSRATPERARLSAVRQRALVRVDEEGTIAAAVTAMPVGYSFAAAGDVVRLVRVDRPFLFAVRHRPTGAILFLGRVEDPTR